MLVHLSNIKQPTRVPIVEPVHRLVQVKASHDVHLQSAELAEDGQFINQVKKHDAPTKLKANVYSQQLLERALQSPQAQLTPTAQRRYKSLVVKRKIMPKAQAPFWLELRRLSRGSSLKALGILEYLISQVQNDTDLQQMGYRQQLLEEFLEEFETQIISSLNVETALKHAPNDSSALRALSVYERVVIESKSVLQAIQRFGRQEGLQNIEQWRKFLSEAVVADLVSVNAGTDKVHLIFLLEEMRTLRMINTIFDLLGEVNRQRLQNRIPSYIQDSLDYIEEPINGIEIFRRWVSACTIPEQIIFFQDMMRFYRTLPEYAYVSVEQKNNTRTIIQPILDELIYNEEE